jgi:mutator protein MutT
MAHATAAVAVILDERGNVLLVRTNYRTCAFQLPGGLVEPGEQPAEAVVRETREETGLVVRVAAYIGRYEFGMPLCLVGFAYLCEIEAGTPVVAADEIRCRLVSNPGVAPAHGEHPPRSSRGCARRSAGRNANSTAVAPIAV